MSDQEQRVWHGDGMVLVKKETGDATKIIEAAFAAAAEVARGQRFQAANTKRHQDKMTRVARAEELRRQGLSAPQIGIKLAREEGRPDDQPYGERQVRKWLGVAKKG